MLTWSGCSIPVLPRPLCRARPWPKSSAPTQRLTEQMIIEQRTIAERFEMAHTRNRADIVQVRKKEFHGADSSEMMHG